MTDFTYQAYKPTKDQRIKQLVRRSIKRPIKVLEVKNLKGNGRKYIGASLYRKNYIVVDKNLSKKDKYETVVHELAHYKMREQNPKFGRNVINELRQTNLYKYLRQQGYARKKIPEEAFAVYYMKLKTNQDRNFKKFVKKNPSVAQKFNQISRR